MINSGKNPRHSKFSTASAALYDERASVEIAAPAPPPPLAAAADPPPAEEVVANEEDATVPDDRWNPYT